MTRGATEEPNELALILLSQLGVNSLTSISPIFGGRNNQAFRLEVGTSSFLMKKYFEDTTGSRDRRRSEWEWSIFCWQNGIEWCPQPLATDASRAASLFEFLEGRRLNRDEVTADHVDQAASFVAEVNRFRADPRARNLSNGAEACFSIDDHLGCVERRIHRLEQLGAVDSFDFEMHRWLKSELIPTWCDLSRQLRIQFIENDLKMSLPDSQRCLSPSDFGFHNALMNSMGKLRFVDFEYAGWDDPAKLVCDFFWQPEVPAPRESRHRLISALSEQPTVDDLQTRIEHLDPVYGIKWCCLLLNEFIASDQRRREFANATLGDRRATQLDAAKRLLVEVREQSR